MDIEYLMDDSSPLELEELGKLKSENSKKSKKESREVRKKVDKPAISEVERLVLICLKETKKVSLISKMTGYPEVVVTKAIERLIEKGYIDEQLNVLRDVSIRKVRKSRTKLLAIDVAIAIAVLILIIAFAYYFFS